jgi:hypothetical protein
MAKRHYRNGYYVSRSNSVLPKPLGREVIEKEKPVFASQQMVGQSVEKNVFADVPDGSDDKGDRMKTEGNSSFKKSVARVKSTALSKINAARSLSFKNSGSLKQYATSHIDRDDDDALSFLWTVIALVLIIWLIAFLMGGWGLGGLIHVLLVIALVLLILWLLRII